MKSFILLSILILLGAVYGFEDLSFESWMSVHQKSYASHDEYVIREAIFLENKNKISQAEEANPLATFELNKFADLSSQEFSSRFLDNSNNNIEFSNMENTNLTPLKAKLPTSVDWTKKGVVPPVHDQGQDGDSTLIDCLLNIESMAAIHQGKIPELSLAQLEDCNKAHHGIPRNVFSQIKFRGGVESEADYPNRAGRCDFDESKISVHVRGYKNVTSETELATALANAGPVTVAVDASSWQFYTGGILETCGQQVDHTALAVGYGVLRSVRDYWILQNTWGTDWGMKGFIWLARNGKNTCGVTQFGAYPTL